MNVISHDRYPDGELPILIDQVINNILTITYTNGLYHEQKVLEILSKITPLDGFQIHGWFNKMQASQNADPPRRQEFMCIQQQKELGQWTDEKRSILEKCFTEDICTPENFAFIGLLTSLSKNQISNWTRQKRYLLRKKGLLPPVDKTKRHTRRKKRKEFAKRNSPYEPSKFLCPKFQNYAIRSAKHCKTRLSNVNVAPVCYRPALMPYRVPPRVTTNGDQDFKENQGLQIPKMVELPEDDCFFAGGGLRDVEEPLHSQFNPKVRTSKRANFQPSREHEFTPPIEPIIPSAREKLDRITSIILQNAQEVSARQKLDEISSLIIQNANEAGLLSEEETLNMVALVCGLRPQQVHEWDTIQAQV